MELVSLHKSDISVLSRRIKHFTWKKGRQTPCADTLSCAKQKGVRRNSEILWVAEVYVAGWRMRLERQVGARLESV